MSDEQHTKEVMYKDYCPKCIHKDVDEVEDPCNECLEQPFNWDSQKPIKFVDKTQ